MFPTMTLNYCCNVKKTLGQFLKYTLEPPIYWQYKNDNIINGCVTERNEPSLQPTRRLTESTVRKVTSNNTSVSFQNSFLC